MRSGRRLTPTGDELRVWRGYIETAEVLRARLAARLQEESALSPGDYQVLLALSEAAERTMRSSDLAAEMGWERSRLSHHLGRMERRGLILRSPCADDSHGIDVRMTDTGAERFRSGSVPHLRAIRELFIDALTTEQLGQIDELTAAVRTHLGLEGAEPTGSSAESTSRGRRISESEPPSSQTS